MVRIAIGEAASSLEMGGETLYRRALLELALTISATYAYSAAV